MFVVLNLDFTRTHGGVGGGGGTTKSETEKRHDLQSDQFKGLSVVSLKSFTCEIELVLNNSYLFFSTSV